MENWLAQGSTIVGDNKNNRKWKPLYTPFDQQLFC